MLKKIALEIKQNEEQSCRESEGVKSKSAKKREELAERRAEAAARKIELKRIAEIEEKEFEAAMKKAVRKATEAELSKMREEELMMILNKAEEKMKRSASEEEYAKMVLVSNTNRYDLIIEASSVDEALAKFSFMDDDLPVDLLPEGRIVGSFEAFEEEEIRRLKEEKPGLLLEQYDNMIMKLWKRSPQSLFSYTSATLKTLISDLERVMCGRARCTLRADDISRACHLTINTNSQFQIDRYRPSYNVTPGTYLPVVRRADGLVDDDVEASVVVHCMKWGLIPSFTKKTDKPDHYRMFNARAESLHEKPSFCHLVEKSRCLVAVDGFYEWWKEGSRKQPYYIHFKDNRPLVFAALYDVWKNAEGEVVHTFTIVTTSSSPALKWLHDRMPVILCDKASTDTWLNAPSKSNLDLLLKPYEESDLVWYPVTPAMGKPSFNGPDCIKEVPFKADSKKISTFFTKKLAESENDSDSAKGTNNKVEGTFSDSARQQKESSSLSKRPQNDTSAMSKLTLEKFDEIYDIPDSKKARVKVTDNKQPTLMSYFVKKQD